MVESPRLNRATSLPRTSNPSSLTTVRDLTVLCPPNDLQQWFAEEKPWDQHSHQKVDIPHEEQKKNWYDLDEKRKKELEVCCGHLMHAIIHSLLFAPYSRLAVV